MDFIFIVLFIIFLVDIVYFIRKTINQREKQITQMDQFIELYKKANGLNPLSMRDE